MLFRAFALLVTMTVGAMADEPYHIGVWYFLRWSSAAKTAPGLHRYGGTDPWAGVRQFAEGRPPFQIAGGPNFTDRKPLIGFYDQMDQSVIDTQIQQAASEGIEFFAFYWYISPITGQELHGVEPVKKFFGSSVRTLKYVLAPLVVDTYKEHLDLRTWTTTVVPQIVSYMRSDAYFRIDGRPLLIDFWLPFDGRAEAYAELRRSVREAIGVDPLIVLLLGGNPHYQDLQFQASHVHPDGFTCFNMGTTRPDKPYADVVHEWLANTLAQSGTPTSPPNRNLVLIPCGSLGIDARPWYQVGWSGPSAEKRPFTTGVTPDLVRHHLQDIRDFIDSRRVNTLRMAIIYAWNEWGEAAQSIEPSEANRYRYADLVRDVFQLTPNGARP